MESESSKLISKASLPRTRDLSFVARYHQNYGFEDEYFQYLLEQKDLWGERLFYMNEKEFLKWVEQGKHKTRDVPVVPQGVKFPEPTIIPKSLDEVRAELGDFTAVELNLTKGSQSARHTLQTHESTSLKAGADRNGIVMNVGGYVAALKWAHNCSPPVLAVFLINNEDGLSKLIADPSLSVFQPQTDSKMTSALQLWSYDVDNSSLTMTHMYNMSAFGATSCLSWLPASFDSDTLGVISGVFSDGKVHFFSIPNALSSATDPTKLFGTIESPSHSISMTDERDATPKQLPITSYDYLSNDKVIVGTIDGAVAEFVLPLGGSDGTTDLIPSFVSYLSDSMINSICVAQVKEAKILLVNTATAQSFAIDYDQIRQGRVETGYTISTLQPLFHRGYRIFIYPDSAESIGYTFAKHPHQKHSLLLKTELISTFHISEYLHHPFAVVGNTCGDVFVLNVGRKIFGVPKAHNKLVVPLKIWSLKRLPDEDIFTLCGDYIPVSPDRNDIMYTFTPPEVVISAAAWNENMEGSSTYAFGTYTGLLVLERLDPVLI